MNEDIVATGFESCIVKSWTGWDGDQECLDFYGVKLTDSVEKFCVERGLDLSHELYVFIAATSLEARVTAYPTIGSDEPSFSHTFKINVAVIL